EEHRIVDNTIGLFGTHSLKEIRKLLSTLLDHVDWQHCKPLIAISRAKGGRLIAREKLEWIGSEGCASCLDERAEMFGEVVDNLPVVPTCNQFFDDGKRWIHMPRGWEVEKNIFGHGYHSYLLFIRVTNKRQNKTSDLHVVMSRSEHLLTCIPWQESIAEQRSNALSQFLVGRLHGTVVASGSDGREQCPGYQLRYKSRLHRTKLATLHLGCEVFS